MEFSFECLCGEETVGLTDGSDETANRARVRCSSCGAVYAITVTNVVAGAEAANFPDFSTQ